MAEENSNLGNTILVVLFIVAVIALGILHYSGYLKKESEASSIEKKEMDIRELKQEKNNTDLTPVNPN